MSVRLLAPLGAALALSGCVVAPPQVVAVPGYNKDSGAFEADQASCRQEASQAAYSGTSHSSETSDPAPIGTRSGNEAAWQRYDDQFAQCMSARGDSLEPLPSQGYGYGYPYAAYGYPYAGYGYPYAVGFGYPFGGFYGGVYDGFGLGFGYGGFARFGYGRFGYGRFGYGYRGGFHGGFGHGGFGHGGGRR